MLLTLTILKLGVWHIWCSEDVWAKTLFSRKNDVQSVANGNRRRVEIELRQCGICWSWSSNRWNLT